MKEFTITQLSKKDIPQMYQGFNAAFSDYLIPMKLTESAFRKKIIQKTNIKFKYSVGSFFKKKLVGFIFHAIDQYEDKKVAYNGGTGVIPEFRGNNLTNHMYDYLLPRLISKEVDSCVLEVISTNIPAIRSYEKIGFTKSKFFHCMKLNLESNYLRSANQRKFDYKEVQRPNWNSYKTFCDYSSSYLDTLHVLKRNMANENFIEVYDESKIIGFIIFNKKMGRIEHLGVDHNYRGQGIGSMLVKKMYQKCRYKPIYILNVNEKAYGLLSFFLRIGFVNDIDQFELVFKLPGK